jgi:chromosome segregation ATPase
VQFHDRKPEAPKTPETPEAPAQPEASSGKGLQPAAENWEERFKGLSKKYNAAQKAGMEALAQQEAKFKAEIEARDAQIKDFKSQLETSAKDLADANAKVSELSAKLDESTKALQTATADLAQVRDSLNAAEDKAAALEKTRDLLTAGVLTPAPEGSTYAEKMKAAKGAAEREALRKQKASGKIK